VGAVAHEVAAAIGGVDADGLDRGQAGLERRQVAVDVGDHRDAHPASFGVQWAA
jgi:hypothetical protein